MKSENFDVTDGTIEWLQDLSEIEAFRKNYEGDDMGSLDVIPASSYSIYSILWTSDVVEETVKHWMKIRPDVVNHPDKVRYLIRNSIRECPGFCELSNRVLDEIIDDKIAQFAEEMEEQ